LDTPLLVPKGAPFGAAGLFILTFKIKAVLNKYKCLIHVVSVENSITNQAFSKTTLMPVYDFYFFYK